MYQRLLESHPHPIDFSSAANKRLTREASSSLFPPELWAEIFLYCLPDLPPDGTPTPWYHRDIYVNTLTAPLLLCQICHSWRQIATSQPQLWQRLAVYVSMGTTYPSIESATLWITRSGTLPLSLTLHQQNESNVNQLITGQMLELFIKHIARWRDIDLHLSGPRMANYTIPEKVGTPLLRRFTMKTDYRVNEREENYIFGIFEDVPRLSHLHVTRIPELDLLGNSVVKVPWSQLASLSLDYVPSIGTALHILNKCRSLQDCTLKVDSLFGPIVDEPLFHPSLRSLFISITHEHFPGFLARITLPALKRLKVHVRGPLEQYGWPQRQFDEFLRRSSCKLTGLELHDSGIRVDQFISILSQRPLQGLEELVVEDRRDWTWTPFITDVVLDLLNCPGYRDAYSSIVFLDINGGPRREQVWYNERPVYLPQLVQLAVRGNCMQSSDGVVAAMAESRWNWHAEAGAKQLRSLKLDIPSNHLMDLQRLKVLQGKGMDLELSFT